MHIDGCVIMVNASREATVANFATVQTEGDRQVERSIEYYNLDVIISVKELREVKKRKRKNNGRRTVGD